MVGYKTQKRKYSQGQTYYAFNFPGSFIILLFLCFFLFHFISASKQFVNAGLLKNAHLLCCAASRTAQRISIYASRFAFFACLASNIFEQPKNMGFFNDLNAGDYFRKKAI
jgi:hypothetical protein